MKRLRDGVEIELICPFEVDGDRYSEMVVVALDPSRPEHVFVDGRFVTCRRRNDASDNPTIYQVPNRNIMEMAFI